MLYSPVRAELGQPLIKLVQTEITQQADVCVRVCVCLRVTQIVGLSKNSSKNNQNLMLGAKSKQWNSYV